MNVTLADANTLRLTFSYRSRSVFEQVKAAVRAIPGREYEKETKSWLVPIRRFDDIVATFPRASYDYDCFCASDVEKSGRAANFYESLVRWGVELRTDAHGALQAVGENVSPLLQELVSERAAALMPFVAEGGYEVPMNPIPERNYVAKGDDSILVAMAAGLKSAKEREDKEREIRKPFRRKRREAEVVQGELI